MSAETHRGGGKPSPRDAVVGAMRVGPSVVLLHGQPGGAWHWERVIAGLPADLAVVAEDRPGYGSNPEPATGMVGNADAVVRTLERRGLPRAVIVAHSWAGGAALALAERHPE